MKLTLIEDTKILYIGSSKEFTKALSEINVFNKISRLNSNIQNSETFSTLTKNIMQKKSIRYRFKTLLNKIIIQRVGFIYTMSLSLHTSFLSLSLFSNPVLPSLLLLFLLHRSYCLQLKFSHKRENRTCIPLCV